MNAVKILLIAFSLFCAFLCFSCCTVAKRADEMAEEMFERYMREKENNDAEFY